MHGLQNSIAILRRWACHTDQPLPDDFKQFQKQHPTEALQIERNDPELAALLSGTASASLRADALEGKLSDKAPDPAVRAEEKRRRDVQDLFDRREELTLTERLQLQVLDPAVYANAMAQIGADQEQSEGDKVQSRLAHQQQMAANSAASRNHSMSQIRGGK